MQSLRDMRDAPLRAWVINIIYLTMTLGGIFALTYWIAETPTETELEGTLKGISLFLFIFVFIAYRMTWDWVLIKLGYLPPYDNGS